MASWAQIEREAPEWGPRPRPLRRRHHKTIATPRGDGSPRISAIEVAFHDGEVTMGMMGGSLKLLDVREGALTYVGEPADHLVIESWHAGRGWRRRTRA